MPTDKTPRDADETLALPVTDADPTTGGSDDDTTAIAVDETAALPLEDRTRAADDTVVIPADEPPADDTAVLPAEDLRWTTDDTDATAAASTEPDPTPSPTLLGTDETRPHPSTSAWSSQDEPAAYTSPIGALYAPADRPDPAPTDWVDPVVEPAPTEARRRRLRVGTVVWGLVIAAIGVGLLAWAAGFAIDLQLAMIVLLAVAGTALLVGSIVSGARAARR